MEYTLIAPCAFGTESVANFEIKKYVSGDTAVTDGQIKFTGDETRVASANIFCRSANRIYIQLAEFETTDFDRLFDGVYRVDFAKFLPENAAFPVKGYSLNSQLSSVPACQRIVKKAIVEKLKKQYKTDTLPESGAVYKISFSLRKNIFTLMLDTSGDALHKRGYRRVGGTAPIKETLAASIADLARVREDSIVADPFCGSGTLLIEAAMRAANISPGLHRSFLSENYKFLTEDVWKSRREKARRMINKDIPFRAYGSDIDKNVISIARRNAKKAGVEKLIKFSVSDVKDFSPLPGAVIISNPPYGERLADIKQAGRLEKILGERVTAGDIKSCYVITSDEDFEKNFGKKAVRKRKLYNGMIPCRLYMYY